MRCSGVNIMSIFFFMAMSILVLRIFFSLCLADGGGGLETPLRFRADFPPETYCLLFVEMADKLRRYRSSLIFPNGGGDDDSPSKYFY
jgi:hypothetical protein